MSTQFAAPSRADAARRIARKPWLPWVALAATVAYSAWYLVLESGKGLFFYYDEWSFLLRRTGHSPDVFLRPHNEHLSAIPVAAFKALLKLFGFEYRAYQWLLMGFVAALGIVVYIYARRRVGPWLALIPAAVVLLGGAYWENTMWVFQIGFIGSVACGVAAFLALDRNTLRGDLCACGLLLLAIAQSSVGLPFLPGVVLELLLRRQWPRLWVPVVPILAYGAWKIAYPVSDFKAGNLSHVPSFVFDAAAGASGSIFGLGRDAGKVILLAFVALAVEAIIRRRTTVRFWSLLGTALAFWVATALARANMQPPDASRYLLPGATMIMLAASETARGWRPNRTAVLLMCAVLPITVAVGHDRLRGGIGTNMVPWAPVVRADVTALDAIEGQVRVDPNSWQPDPLRAPDITAALYFDTASRYGHAGESPDKLRAENPEARGVFDAVVLFGTATHPKPSGPPNKTPAPVQIEQQQNAGASASGGCVVAHSPAEGDGFVEVVVPRGGIRYRATSQLPHVGLRLVGDAPVDMGPVEAGRWFSVAPPAIKAPGDWYARFDLAGGRRLLVCGA